MTLRISQDDGVLFCVLDDGLRRLAGILRLPAILRSRIRVTEDNH